MSLAVPTTHRFSGVSQTSQNNPASEFGQDDEQALFSRDELRQFAADDAAAGRSIVKILSALFIYTLIAMSVVIWWTLRTVGH